jgi:hypothetical protein
VFVNWWLLGMSSANAAVPRCEFCEHRYSRIKVFCFFFTKKKREKGLFPSVAKERKGLLPSVATKRERRVVTEGNNS